MNIAVASVKKSLKKSRRTRRALTFAIFRFFHS